MSPNATPISTLALTPTSLAELDAAAGLLTRIDRKYLVPAASAQALVTTLADQARVLEIDGLRNFAYTSVYFDTPDLSSYFLAAHRRRRRFKVRTRSYVDSKVCFLEVKTRGPRGATVKNRVAYEMRNNDRLTRSGRESVTQNLASAGIESATAIASDLEPVLGIAYHRTTLHLPASNSRVTIDTALSWTGTSGQHADATGVGIVETKSSSTPSHADRILWRLGHRPMKVSKYATGLAILNPDLPANAWNRVMTHGFAHVSPISPMAA